MCVCVWVFVCLYIKSSQTDFFGEALIDYLLRILGEKTMNDKLMYIPNDDNLNNPSVDIIYWLKC